MVKDIHALRSESSRKRFQARVLSATPVYFFNYCGYDRYGECRDVPVVVWGIAIATLRSYSLEKAIELGAVRRGRNNGE